MEIKDGATDVGNSSCNPPPPTSSYSLLPDQALTVGTLSNFRQRSDINVGRSFGMTTEALVAREIEKRKIKEEIITYGYLKRRELEEEAIRELILEREIAMRQAEGVSLINSPLFSLQSGLGGLISNCRDTVALHKRLAPVNRLDGGGINSAISLANRLEGGIDGRIPQVIRMEDVIDGVLPLWNRLDDSVDGRLSMVNRPDGRLSDGLPFHRQPGVTSGVASKPVIDLRKAVPLAKPATSNASVGSMQKLETSTVYSDDGAALAGNGEKSQKLTGSKRKLETPTVDSDDGAALAGKGKKSQKGWSCVLCQVKATCEQVMKDHLNGKKHKAKEKAMQRTTNPVSHRSNKSDSLTASPKPSNIVGENQDRRNVEVLSPKQQHADTDGGSGAEVKQKIEELKNKGTDFKFWCNMCEVGTTSEALMTAHRIGKKHMSLLKNNGGGVIAIKTIPDDVQYVELSRNITVNEEKEVSLSNGDGQGGGVGADEQETTDKCTMEVH